MKQPVDHDIRVWITSEQYLLVRREAEKDDRSVSGYVRQLIKADLARVLARELDRDRAMIGSVRDGAGR